MKGRWIRLWTRLKSRAYRDALTEVALTVITATLPIWFFPLMALFVVGATYSLHLLDHSISNGELFLLCTALTGPLFYILFRVYEVPEGERYHGLKYQITWVFPHAITFGAVIFFVCIISAAIFGLQKINPRFLGEDISRSGYLILSAGLFVIAVTALYWATAIRNEMDNYSPSRLMKKDEDDFVRSYKSEEPQL